MKKSKRTALIVLGLVVAFFAHRYLFPDDEALITNMIYEVIELSQIKGEEHPFEGLGRAKSIGQYFSKEISFELKTTDYHIKRIRTREALVQRIVAGRRTIKELNIEIKNLDISVKGDAAVAKFEAEARFIDPHTQERVLDGALVEASLFKEDGDWLINKLEGFALYR